MSDAPCAFSIGDKVVLARLGPDQPEGVVTAINALRTCPSICTVSVAFASGKQVTLGPTCLRPASEKSGLPITRPVVEPSAPYLPATSVHSPILVPDWEVKDVSEARLAEAVADWERSVGYIESGYDYRNDPEELQLDVFSREVVHAVLLGFASLNMPVPDTLAARIAHADQRYSESTVESASIWGAQDYNPKAFWYYFRRPISS